MNNKYEMTDLLTKHLCEFELFEYKMLGIFE